MYIPKIFVILLWSKVLQIFGISSLHFHDWNKITNHQIKTFLSSVVCIYYCEILVHKICIQYVSKTNKLSFFLTTGYKQFHFYIPGTLIQQQYEWIQNLDLYFSTCVNNFYIKKIIFLIIPYTHDCWQIWKPLFKDDANYI